jgi:hypothetical protein
MLKEGVSGLVHSLAATLAPQTAVRYGILRQPRLADLANVSQFHFVNERQERDHLRCSYEIQRRKGSAPRGKLKICSGVSSFPFAMIRSSH